MNVVELARYSYRHEAEIAAGFLEDAGIPALVQVDDAGGYDFGLSFARPARLLVPQEQLARAREVLEDTGFEGMRG
jgi:hypothetical protein